MFELNAKDHSSSCWVKVFHMMIKVQKVCCFFDARVWTLQSCYRTRRQFSILIQNTFSKCHFLTILFVNIRFFDGWVTFKHERITLFSITFRNRVDFHSVYGVSTCFVQYTWKILLSSVVLSVFNTCHVRWKATQALK